MGGRSCLIEMAWYRIYHGAITANGNTGTLTNVTTDMKVILNIRNSGNIQPELTCGTGGSIDTNNNYSTRGYSSDINSSDYTRNTQDSIETERATNGNMYLEFRVTNISNKEKLFIGHALSDESTPTRWEITGKWKNTSGQIDIFGLKNTQGGSIASGSTITVLGATSDTVTDEKTTLTNVPVGTQYRETDTRKMYRFLGAETTPTFTENFTADNWDDKDSGVAGVSTSNKRLDFVAKADNSNDSTAYDFRGDQNFIYESADSQKQLDESANKYGILLASNNPRIGQELHSITFRMRKQASPTGNVSAKIYKSNSTSATATSTNTLDVSTLHGTNYNAKTFEFASGVTLENGDRIVVEGGSHDGTNKIQFQQNTSGFTDTVSIARYTSSWVDGISGDFRYALATKDQVISETAWVLRWEYTRVSGGGSGNGHNHSFGLGKHYQEYHSGDATDAIYWAWGEPQNSGQSYMGIQALDETTGNSNGHFPTSGSRVQNVDLTANKKYYMELKRESASKATFTVWSDEYDGTALSGFPVSNTSEVVSSLSDLQYIKWQNRGSDGVRSGTLTGYIENVKFYNGITSIPASGWKERGTA